MSQFFFSLQTAVKTLDSENAANKFHKDSDTTIGKALKSHSFIFASFNTTQITSIIFLLHILSDRQCRSYDDCLKGNRKDYQNNFCSMLY